MISAPLYVVRCGLVVVVLDVVTVELGVSMLFSDSALYVIRPPILGRVPPLIKALAVK
jgi:hypothetical protein